MKKGLAMKNFMLVGVTAVALLATPVFAADLPTKAPVSKTAPAPVFSWTGCYIGGNAGIGWSTQTYTELGDGDQFNKFTADGWAAGGQIGCDYQSGAWVVGIQGLWDWSNVSGQGTETIDTDFYDTAKVNSLATLTGRLGYALQPMTLVYIKGGAAWIRTHYFDGLIAGGAESSANLSRSGWTFGGGFEHMLAPNWSAFIEYNYANFGTQQPTFNPPIFFTNVHQNLQTFLVGVNYRFSDGLGKAPVSAKY
jgi:outer membrane immunogenic protein